MKGPSRQECGHNAGNVVGIDDLVQGKQGGVIIIRKVGIHLRGQDVIVVVEHGQVFHQAEVDLNDKSTVWTRRWRLPSRGCKTGESLKS